jgi:hypothetical protein
MNGVGRIFGPSYPLLLLAAPPPYPARSLLSSTSAIDDADRFPRIRFRTPASLPFTPPPGHIAT